MKKAIIFLITCLMMLGMMAGCVAPPPDENDFIGGDLSGEINLDIDKNITDTLNIGFSATDAEEVIINSLVKSFNEEYPNVKFQFTKITGAYDTMLAANIPAGTMPDIFWINPVSLSYYYDNGIALVLDKYIQESGLPVQNYFAKAMEECKSPAGHYYMLPRAYSQIVVYYNKELLSNAGITQLPADNWTWDDFMAMCKTIRASGVVGEQYPIIDAEWNWEATYYPMIRSLGGDIINEKGELVLDKGLDTKPEENPAYQFLGMMMQMKADKLIPENLSAVSSSTSFYGGFSPFYVHSRDSLTLGVNALGDNLGVLPFPAIGETPYVGGGATGYGIYRDSKKKDLAWAFLYNMMSEAGQIALSKTGNIIPTMLSQLNAEDPVWKDYPANAKVDHDKFIANSDRVIDPQFLKQLDSSTHVEAFGYIRTMLTNVLYYGTSRVQAIRSCADAIYSLQNI